MHKISPLVWPLTALALVALPAIAQVNTPPAITATAPTASASAAVALPYRSVFIGYQPFTEEKVKSWKDTNTTVEKIGGWRAYAKEVAEPASADAMAPATPAAPPPNPHAGHGKH
jgi:hypothetical protein